VEVYDMPDLLDIFHREWPVIKQAPYSFFISLFVLAVMIWAFFEWRHRKRLEKVEEAALAHSQSDRVTVPVDRSGSSQATATGNALTVNFPPSSSPEPRVAPPPPKRESLPVKVEFEPSALQLEKIFLTVKNVGAKQTFRAQCRVVERRNDPNPQVRMTFDLLWQHGGREKHLQSWESGNLLIASAGEDKSRGMEWMKLEGEHAPDSRWPWPEKIRPEYDLDITVLGNQSDEPQTGQFTLRAGTSCALEMYKRECQIFHPPDGAGVSYKSTVSGMVSPPNAKVQLWVYAGGQWHNNGFAKVVGSTWEKECCFGNPDTPLGGVYPVIAVANGTIAGNKQWKTLPMSGTHSNKIEVRRSIDIKLHL
jgi:hypothetical protein